MSRVYRNHCDYCGAVFETTYPHKKFCRDEHRIAFNAIVDRNNREILKGIRESVRQIVRAHHPTTQQR